MSAIYKINNFLQVIDYQNHQEIQGEMIRYTI
jgi:hypothetical protein